CPERSDRSARARAPAGRSRWIEWARLSLLASKAEHEPGDKSGNPHQHREGVVIEIAGLDLHDVTSDIEDPCGHAVRTEPVDDIAIALLPEETPDPFRRTHEDEVVELVEVPFVEQEL